MATGDVEAPTCFVIGPIGNRNAEVGTEERTLYEESIQVWESVIEPAARGLGLNPVRADHISRAGDITDQVFRLLRDSDVVIADVTDANPNVMYELGLRHTRDALTVQLGEADRLPFDIAAVRTIQFRRSEGGLIEARNRLRDALETGLGGNFDPVAATRVWNEETRGVEAGLGEAELAPAGADAAEDEEEGFLDLMARMEETLPEITLTVQQMGAESEALGEETTRMGEEIERSDAQGRGAVGRLAIAARFSRTLDESAARMEGLAERYEEQMRATDPGVTYILSQLEVDEAARAEATEFIDSVRGIGPSMSQFRDSTTQSAEIMAGLGRIARPLRAPSQRMAAALRRIVATTLVASRWAERAERLANGDPPPLAGEV